MGIFLNKTTHVQMNYIQSRFDVQGVCWGDFLFFLLLLDQCILYSLSCLGLLMMMNTFCNRLSHNIVSWHDHTLHRVLMNECVFIWLCISKIYDIHWQPLTPHFHAYINVNCCCLFLKVWNTIQCSKLGISGVFCP